MTMTRLGLAASQTAVPATKILELVDAGEVRAARRDGYLVVDVDDVRKHQPEPVSIDATAGRLRRVERLVVEAEHDLEDLRRERARCIAELREVHRLPWAQIEELTGLTRQRLAAIARSVRPTRR